MLVLNLSDSKQIIKGVELQVGLNTIPDDSPITEADNSESIGVGAEAIAHYNALIPFWDSAIFVNNDSLEYLIEHLGIEISKTEAQLRDLAIKPTQTSGFIDLPNGDNSAKLLIELKTRINKKKQQVARALERLKTSEIKQEDLDYCVSYFEGIDNPKFNFKQTQYAREALAEAKATMWQQLPYKMQKLKKKVEC